MANCLLKIENGFRKQIPLFQGHAIKRGTVSILKKLGVSVEQINLHVGWSVTSKMFATYLRFVVINDIDLLFFHDVLSLEVGL